MTQPANSKIVQSTRQLLAIESTPQRPENLQAALDFVESGLKKVKGVNVEHFQSGGKPSLLAYFGDARPDRFDCLLNAHVDVVPGNPDQFQPAVTDGRLFGRGAADMKTAAVIMADLFCELAPALSYSLGLQVVTDEEIGGYDGTKYQVDHGVSANFVLAGEDTPPNCICTDMCGICWVEFEVKGQSAHAGYVWRGDNAVLKAGKIIDKLLQAFPSPKQDAWVTTANIAYVETPSKLFNRVPDLARFGVDFRYVPTDERFATKASIEQYLNSLDDAVTVTIKQFEPSHSTSSENSGVRQLAAALEKTTGTTPTFVKRHGAADVRFYSSKGMAAVTMGLPDNFTHATGEYVELAAITEYRAVLNAFLSDFKPDSPSSLRKSQQT